MEAVISGLTENLIKKKQNLFCSVFGYVYNINSDGVTSTYYWNSHALGYSHIIYIPFQKMQILKSSGLNNPYLLLQFQILFL